MGVKWEGEHRVASSKDRERKLARAKIERQMARRAAQARRQRQIQARIAAGVAVLLIAVGIYWGLNLGHHGKSSPTAANPVCTWNPITPASTPASGSPSPAPSPSGITDVGEPPTTNIATSGYDTMTMTTSAGTIVAELDLTGAPCSAASLSFLAGQGFYDNSSCPRITVASNNGVLYCGTTDPGYQFSDENLPYGFAPSPGAAPRPSGDTDAPAAVVYPAGTVAMDNSGTDTNGGRFFIVYKDTVLPPDYSWVGNVTSGLDVITKIAKAGVSPGASATDGKPRTPVNITSLTVTAAAPSSSPSVAPVPSSSSPAA